MAPIMTLERCTKQTKATSVSVSFLIVLYVHSQTDVMVNIIQEESKSYDFASSILDNVTKSGSVALKIPTEKLLSNGEYI